MTRLLLPKNHEAVPPRHTQAPAQTGTKVQFNSDIPETTGGTAQHPRDPGGSR